MFILSLKSRPDPGGHAGFAAEVADDVAVRGGFAVGPGLGECEARFGPQRRPRLPALHVAADAAESLRTFTVASRASESQSEAALDRLWVGLGTGRGEEANFREHAKEEVRHDAAFELVKLPAVVPRVHAGAATAHALALLVVHGRLELPLGILRPPHHVLRRCPFVLTTQYIRLVT